MSFHLVLAACILTYLHGAIIVFATSDFNLYTDGTCQDLYANVQTDTKAGDGDCGQANGIYSVSVSSLDPGCYLTIYSDFCSSNPTAVRIGQCTTLQNSIEIDTFSVDCPQDKGALDGYTTSLAAAAQTSSQSPTPFESTMSSQELQQVPTTSIQSSSQEPQQVSTTSIQSSSQEPPQVPTTSTQSSSQEPLQDSITSTPSPSSSGSTSSSQEPQQVPTTSTQSSSSSSTSDSPTPEFSSSPLKDLQKTSSPASPSPTTTSDLSSKTLPPSSSIARSSSSISSPSETALGNGTKGGIGKDDTIIACVFGSLGFIGIVVSGVLVFKKYRKRKQRKRVSEPPNVVSRSANNDRPALHSLYSGSTVHRSSQDLGLGPQPRRNGELDHDVYSDHSEFDSMPTAPQGHPPFSSMS